MNHFLWHWLSIVVGLLIISHIPFLGISADHVSSFIWAGLVLIFVNAFIRPILIIISLPMVLLSLGLFLLVINGIIFYCLPEFVSGFHVASFHGAVFGSILLSVCTWAFGHIGRSEREQLRRPEEQKRVGEVIDI